MTIATFSKISIDLLSVILLIFLGFLIIHNTVMPKKNARHFAMVLLQTLVVVLAEIITVIFDVPVGKYRILNIIADLIGFSFAPVITLSIAALFNEKLKNKIKIVILPIVLNFILVITSPFTGWIFKIDQNNHYLRGNLFFVYLLVCIYGMIVLFLSIFKYSKKYDIADRLYLYGLFTILAAGNIIQFLFHNVLIIWGCTSISFLLYYIFLRELQFRYDPLTKMLNRQVFERAMEEISELNYATIMVFDINSLKYINDNYGHRIGDHYVREAANTIQESFSEIGKCYRIGGDEFCVLSKITDQEKIQAAVNKMVDQIEKSDSLWKNYFFIAVGYALYNKKTMDNVYVAFTEADRNMYLHKERSKKKNEEYA